MAYPGATVYSCDGDALVAIDYDAVEHVRIMRDFLSHPENYLRHLMNPD
jgi:predicted ATPase